MFVTSLENVYWDEEGHQSQMIELPSWDDVVQAVGRLDGEKYDGVMLNGPGGSSMGIVGGRAGEFVVAGRRPDGRPFILVDARPATKWIAVNVGGQENQYADNEVVSEDAAFAVARTFFDSGECDRRFQWNEKAAKVTNRT